MKMEFVLNANLHLNIIIIKELALLKDVQNIPIEDANNVNNNIILQVTILALYLIAYRWTTINVKNVMMDIKLLIKDYVIKLIPIVKLMISHINVFNVLKVSIWILKENVLSKNSDATMLMEDVFLVELLSHMNQNLKVVLLMDVLNIS